jgi:hypothetical protein
MIAADLDGTSPGAVRLVAVDRALAVPAAHGSRHGSERTLIWLLPWLLILAFKIANGL